MIFKVGGLSKTEIIAKNEYQMSGLIVVKGETTQVVLH